MGTIILYFKAEDIQCVEYFHKNVEAHKEISKGNSYTILISIRYNKDYFIKATTQTGFKYESSLDIIDLYVTINEKLYRFYDENNIGDIEVAYIQVTFKPL